MTMLQLLTIDASGNQHIRMWNMDETYAEQLAADLGPCGAEAVVPAAAAAAASDALLPSTVVL